MPPSMPDKWKMPPDRRTAEVVNVVTNSNLKFEDGETEVDMCVALEEMKKESEQNGLTKGILNCVRCPYIWKALDRRLLMSPRSAA